LKDPEIKIRVQMSKAETKGLIGSEVKKRWQRIWDNDLRGRHLYSIQSKVGVERANVNNRKKDVIMTRLRIGHSAESKFT